MPKKAFKNPQFAMVDLVKFRLVSLCLFENTRVYLLFSDETPVAVAKLSKGKSHGSFILYNLLKINVSFLFSKRLY